MKASYSITAVQNEVPSRRPLESREPMDALVGNSALSTFFDWLGRIREVATYEIGTEKE